MLSQHWKHSQRFWAVRKDQRYVFAIGSSVLATFSYLRRAAAEDALLVFGLSSRYVGSDPEKVTANGHSFGKTKGDQARARNSDKACARKGDRTPRQNVPQSNKAKRKQAAAASAVALPSPPLLTEEELDGVKKFQADFERLRGRKLLGAK